MAKRFTPTKWRGTKSGFLPSGRSSVSWMEKLESTSCETLLELGALVVDIRRSGPCSKGKRESEFYHHWHQFGYDRTQKQCCQCELVVVELDYKQLQEEGLI